MIDIYMFIYANIYDQHIIYNTYKNTDVYLFLK